MECRKLLQLSCSLLYLQAHVEGLTLFQPQQACSRGRNSTNFSIVNLLLLLLLLWLLSRAKQGGKLLLLLLKSHCGHQS